MSLLAQGLARHLGQAAISRLQNASIGIMGAGGLGSNVAMLLVRSGIGHLIVADKDKVDISNLNRQYYLPDDIGQPKVKALEKRLRILEPELSFNGHETWVDENNVFDLFAGCRMVVECLDDAGAKARLCALLVGRGILVIAASGLAGSGLTPLSVKRLGGHLICVGDFTSEVSSALPALAPRVMQAAAMQADIVVARLLSGTGQSF